VHSPLWEHSEERLRLARRPGRRGVGLTLVLMVLARWPKRSVLTVSATLSVCGDACAGFGRTAVSGMEPPNLLASLV
jgi:hypothetical protein